MPSMLSVNVPVSLKCSSHAPYQCSSSLPVPSTAITTIQRPSYGHQPILAIVQISCGPRQPPRLFPCGPPTLVNLNLCALCSPHAQSQQVALISLRGSFFQSSHPHQPWRPALSLPSVSVFSRRPMFGGSSRKVAGLSKAATTHGFKCSIRTSGVLTAGKQGQRKEETDAKRRLHIQDMSNDDRDIVESMFSPFALLSLGLSLGGYCPFALPAVST
ncbi:uncharacterized protein HD556DRAFT_1445713 [Suillus plorans]|uniref:Uncharacterized protein n=1 Tax=Suillus plorans TaxID=116603 RepID=A0A9P7DF49_9AGAM|nr:uncharacterized protein HD556DRAFT_1445713 [Suillus plorans]KAG1790937.1 hypothetical protein HD556DRAFT_1445713 [Suillus plorans]